MYSQMTKKEEISLNGSVSMSAIVGDKTLSSNSNMASASEKSSAAAASITAVEKDDKKVSSSLTSSTMALSGTASTAAAVIDEEDSNLKEYARLIGINPEIEPHLMWIAEEGFTQPLTQEWKTVQLKLSHRDDVEVMRPQTESDAYYDNFYTSCY